MRDRPPELSIIIPTYNEEKRLPRTLASIRDYFAVANKHGDQMEILVVDDGSTDETVTVVRQWMCEMPCLKLVLNGQNRERGTASAVGCSKHAGA